MYRDKKDKLDALILLAGDALVEKNLKTDLLDGAPLVKRPKSLDRKIARMIQHERRKPYNEVFVIMKQTAAVFLVVCTLMFAMAMSVDAVREAFWNAVVEWFDKYISVVYETEVDPPDVIEEYKEPQLVPVGAERVVVVKNEYYQVINYYLDNTLVFNYKQSILDNRNHYYDQNIQNTEKLMINNYYGYFINFDNHRNSLCWNCENYHYEIFFHNKSLDIPLLISIAESLS